jgi:hypothetical protein
VLVGSYISSSPVGQLGRLVQISAKTSVCRYTVGSFRSINILYGAYYLEAFQSISETLSAVARRSRRLRVNEWLCLAFVESLLHEEIEDAGIITIRAIIDES